MRFQIEFNFRDAMAVLGTGRLHEHQGGAICASPSLSFFMVNVSHVLLQQLRQTDADGGILDLKSFYRGRRYAIETLNLLPEPPSSFLSDQIVRIVTALGSIHRRSAA
ncbi:MAG: hypothetical protein R2838_01665 [Caldilineaceae bacterium]